MAAIAEQTVTDILMADVLDYEAILMLRHRVRQYRKIRETLAEAIDRIQGAAPTEKEARLGAAYWLMAEGEQAQGHGEAAKDFADKARTSLGKAKGSALAALLLGQMAETAPATAETYLKDALARYEEACKIADNNAACVLMRLDTKRRMGWDGAVMVVRDAEAMVKIQETVLEEAEKLEREFGDKPGLHYIRGRCLEALGEYDRALEAYEQAIAQGQRPAESLFLAQSYYHAARLLDLRGHDETARTYYEKIGPESEDTYWNACLNLALIYEDEGDYQEAVRCCEQVLAMDPNNTRAKLSLASAEASVTMYYSPEETKQSEKLEAQLRIPVSDFELSVRSRNCLAKMNINTLGDLVKRTESELLAYKNFGETSLREIREILHIKNLRLGMLREDAATRAAYGRQKTKQREEILNKPIDEMELSVRSRKAMDSLGIRVIGDLTSRSEAELASVKNFGRVSLNEIKKRLQEMGLGLRDNGK